MSVICDEFLRDIDVAIGSIEYISLAEMLSLAPTVEIAPIAGTNAHQAILEIQSKKATLRIDHNIIRGSLILYSVGRFESYVREIIQDACDRLIAKAGTYDRLPKRLQENLTIFTATVMLDPRKYGHGDAGMRSFVSTLAKNFDQSLGHTEINSKCISITEANMRPKILAELFSRLGWDKFLDKLSQQAKILEYFSTADAVKALSDLQTTMNNLIDLRNRIAHPAATFTWPPVEEIIGYHRFLRTFAENIDSVANMLVASFQPNGAS